MTKERLSLQKDLRQGNKIQINIPLSHLLAKKKLKICQPTQ